MRIIFEKDIDKQDYLEIILTENDLDNIERRGSIKEFINEDKILNVYIRMEKKYADEIG